MSTKLSSMIDTAAAKKRGSCNNNNNNNSFSNNNISKMLTPNPNQYLRPEYLSPLPTTLDAKKSPLALLAQTCSNIGLDSPNHKPMLSVNGGESKSSKSGKPSDSKKSEISSGHGSSSAGSATGNSNSSSSDSDKSQPAFKPYDLDAKKSPTPPRSESKDEDRRSRSSPLSQRSPRTSPAVSEKSGKATPKGGAGSPAVSNSSAASITSAATTTLSGLGYPGLEHLSRGDPKESLAALSLAYKNLAAVAGHPLAGAHPSLPGAHHPFDFKGLHSPYGPGLSSYAGYARVKTPSGGVSLVPVCRDPMCTSCQLSMQSAQLAPCPSGCTSCTHERIVPPAIPFLPGLHGSSALFPSYPAHPLAGRAPNVCSWMIGDSYCGKRFTSSEELLAHLRTHTSLAGAPGDLPSHLLTPPTLSPFGGATTSPPLAAPMTPLAPLPPPPTSSASLRRSYPSPSLSPIGSSSARFHPYSSPPTSKNSTNTSGSSSSTGSLSSASSNGSTTASTPPALTPPLSGFPTGPFPPLPHPSAAALSMFSMYNPYAMYGQRLGPPVHP